MNRNLDASALKVIQGGIKVKKDSENQRIEYAVEMITSLAKLLERDVPETVLMMMNCLAQMLASEIAEEAELRKRA